jgi:hypothetical protein
MNKEKILTILKNRGLNIAEDQLASFVEAVFDDFLPEIVAATDNTIDDMVVAALGSTAKKLILAQVDKIDGEDDEGR